jgi:hypothetical protein
LWERIHADYFASIASRFPLAAMGRSASDGGTAAGASAPAAGPQRPNEDPVKARYLCLSACAAVLALGAAPLRAADEAPSHPANQREKFAACAHQSRGKKADERRAFMSDCLKKHDAAHPRGSVSAQASGAAPRAACTVEADRRKLEGEERRAFLGSCEKG